MSLLGINVGTSEKGKRRERSGMGRRASSLRKMAVALVLLSSLSWPTPAEVPVLSSVCTIVEHDRRVSTYDFGLDDVRRGDTWLTELEFKNPPVRVPLVREDNSRCSEVECVGTIDDHYIAVNWLVPDTLIHVSWTSTQPPGRCKYSGHVLLLVASSRVGVLQRVFGSEGIMSVTDTSSLKVKYEYLGVDKSGKKKIERVVEELNTGWKDDTNGSTDWAESVETRTVYVLEKDKLKEASNSNWVTISRDEQSIPFDKLIDMAWSRLPKEGLKSQKTYTSREEFRRLIKQNALRIAEKGSDHSLQIPYAGQIVQPIDPKTLGYPISDIVQLGWVKNE